jgi:hypothetical protein
VLDDANVDVLLERAAGLSEPELRQLVMRIRFEAAAPPPRIDFASVQLEVADPPAAIVAADAVATSTVHPREELQAVTLWVGREFREDLEAVRQLLGHAVPSGKTDEVLLTNLAPAPSPAKKPFVGRMRFERAQRARV